MQFFIGLLLKFFTKGTLSAIGGIIKNLSDEHVAIVQAKTGLDAAEAAAVVAAEQTRLAAQQNIMVTQMSHPVWWVAWACFVFPVAVYHALIFNKSIMCVFFDAACHWDIKEVPATQNAWAMYVVLSFFGFAVASGVVQAIAGRIGRN